MGETARIKFELEGEAPLDELTKNWTERERQALLDGDEEACELAIDRVLHNPHLGEVTTTDFRILR